MEGAPEVPAALTEAVLRAASTSTESIFLPWVAERITLRWSQGDDVNLGLTRFEAKTTDLVRARHLRLDPGPITIELHPDLAQDERMMHHVYAHELLHASGLTAHSEEHDRLTAEVAPAPPLAESPLPAALACQGARRPTGPVVDLRALRLHVGAHDRAHADALHQVRPAVAKPPVTLMRGGADGRLDA